jgi:tetratricopeptide (TPR) repeat protein
MRALAEQFFEHMGVSRPVIDRMLRHLRTPPLVADELPIHPSVSRHFGLDFLGDDPAWRFTEEGRFSTEAFYLKYMRFEWNRDLEAGLALWHHGELESAMERLDRAISTSPRAAKAYFIQSLILWRWNRRDDAVLNARCAVELEPGEPEFRLHLASLLVDLAAAGGRREEFLRAAEQEARTAVQLDLGSWHALGVLSHVLEQQGRYAEAVEPLGDAIALEPEGADFHARFGHLHEHLNEFGAAEKAIAGLWS